MSDGERAADIFDRLMVLWQEPWSEPAFGEAQALVARLRAALAAPPSDSLDVLITDEVGHAVHNWLAGGVDPRRHNAGPDGEPLGDCYKCRRVRDFILAAIESDDAKEGPVVVDDTGLEDPAPPIESDDAPEVTR